MASLVEVVVPSGMDPTASPKGSSGLFWVWQRLFPIAILTRVAGNDRNRVPWLVPFIRQSCGNDEIIVDDRVFAASTHWFCAARPLNCPVLA